ncbi:hypothetical protein B0A48_10850 [Cryoendolithus antarcticus]|uniref:F-box domain-containing protein n=1 Tax=Cryoendolithus antarcticus TaxID=1507870 RepID=A0A1V8SYU2_9PEZI|nr:hypothetical protein B0A48_10850 [Cryoendolithus antarcticus]
MIKLPRSGNDVLQRKAKRPSFLDFPAEIRNAIYEYVVGNQSKGGLSLRLVRRRHYPVHALLRTMRKKLDAVRGKAPHEFSLLQVNKQVHQEAKHLVWDINIIMDIFPFYTAWTSDLHKLEHFMSTEYIERRILRAFKHIGHRFEHVSTLAIIGFDTLALMLAAPSFNVGDGLRAASFPDAFSAKSHGYIAHLAKLRRRLNSVKDALVVIRWAVPHVNRIVIWDTCFDSLFRHPVGMLWLAVIASDPICHHETFRKCFPHLSTLHLRGLEEEVAYEVYWSREGAWREQESGEVVPEAEDPYGLASWNFERLILLQNSSKRQGPGKPSGFLSLPGEIRNIIYEMCLPESVDGISLKLVRRKIETLLLRTSKEDPIQQEYEYSKGAWREKGDSKALTEYSTPATVLAWAQRWHVAERHWVTGPSKPVLIRARLEYYQRPDENEVQSIQGKQQQTVKYDEWKWNVSYGMPSHGKDYWGRKADEREEEAKSLREKERGEENSRVGRKSGRFSLKRKSSRKSAKIVASGR